MIRGIRLVSVERGFDPRDFALVCFGGAGPVHGVRLAQELNMPKLLVPGGPGVTCALGLLMADFRHDYSQTFISPVVSLDPSRLNAAFEAIESRARVQMIAEGFAEGGVQFTRAADMRYGGQGYEIEIGLPNDRFDKNMMQRICVDFGRLHRDNYGYEMSADTVEIVTLRLSVIGSRLKPEFLQEPAGAEDPASAYKSHRRVFMDGKFLDIPIYERGRLASGMRVKAPAIVEQVDSTTVLFPGYALEVDSYRNLIIEQKET
jgi:N-methylhydantoinase A